MKKAQRVNRSPAEAKSAKEKAARFHHFAVDLYRHHPQLPNASSLAALENAGHLRIVQEQGGSEKTAELLRAWKQCLLEQLPENDFSLALAKDGDSRAMSQVVAANLGLAGIAAKKFMHLRAPRGMTPKDVVQSAITHLPSAVENFDFTRGYRFGTFAIKHIYNSLLGEWRDEGTIRLPRVIQEKQSKLEKAETQLKLRLGRKPSDDEVADLMKIMPSVLAELRSANTDPASLNAPVRNRGRGTVEFGSLIPDKTRVEDSLELEVLVEEALRGLSNLHPGQQATIRALMLLPFPAPSTRAEHALNAFINSRKEPPTQVEVAAHLENSSSRVNQLFSAGVKNLRNHLLEQGLLKPLPKK